MDPIAEVCTWLGGGAAAVTILQRVGRWARDRRWRLNERWLRKFMATDEGEMYFGSLMDRHTSGERSDRHRRIENHDDK